LHVAPAIGSAANVVFVNQSAWEIHEVYFSPASESNWGDDYLEKQVLENGDSLTLSGVETGTWDVMIVDEDGDKCVLEDVTISGSERWIITDKDLLACQAGS
jgi:hypothetical protein